MNLQTCIGISMSIGIDKSVLDKHYQTPKFGEIAQIMYNVPLKIALKSESESD